ncbi:hypothetical protein BCV70DRAFT_144319, partial [Testicularia cyperi]
GTASSSRGGRRANFGGTLTTTTGGETSTSAAADASSSSRAQGSSGAIADDDDDELPPEGETCFICAEPIKLHSVAPCDHRTCHICAIRLRVLYKKNECTFCKSHIDRLIFTASATKPFAEFTPSDIPYHDAKTSISFETREAQEDTLLLLRFNCPDPQCEVASTGWKDFKFHAKRDHHRLLCELCIRNKKIFAHEHTLHTSQSLRAHMDTEHRLCGFCNDFYYGDDELFVHMRDKHEQCHICKARGSEAERWKYYENYRMLERHFNDAHYLCPFPDCIDKKFVVFESEMDFKAHQMAEHANELTSQQRREAMRVDINFSYDDPSTSTGHGASRSGGGKGRGNAGRDAASSAAEGASSSQNRDVLGVSSLASRSHVPGAGPANHQSRRAMFGSGLTSGEVAPQGVSADTHAGTHDSRSTEERHQAYMNKVSDALKGSEARITSFRLSVRAFRSGESSARDLISTIHSLVGEVDDCAPLVNGLVELLDDADKKKAMLDAWNQYRVDRTQFPSLVPAGGASGAAGSGLTPGSGYAGAGNRGAGPSLRNIKNTSSGSTSIPGSLAHAVSANAALRSGAGGSSATPWAASSAVSTPNASGASTPKPYVTRASGANSVIGKSIKASSSSAFPSLPTNAAKASINAHKKALFANRNATPQSGFGSGSGSGKLSPNMGSGGAGGNGLGSLDGLSEALAASQRHDQGQNTSAAGSKKKKQKGVQLMSLGGVHR